jgi:hypothetical protein
MYGNGGVFAADFSRWMRLSMMLLLRTAEMTGNHGGQLKLPGYTPRRLAYFPQ